MEQWGKGKGKEESRQGKVERESKKLRGNEEYRELRKGQGRGSRIDGEEEGRKPMKGWQIKKISQGKGNIGK